MSSETLLWILIPANLPLYYLAWRMAFGNMEEFVRCLKFVITPDIVSLFRGQWGEDQWASFKFLLWLGGCAGLVYLELQFLSGRFDPDPALPAEMPL